MSIAENIKALREKHGMTQAEFGKIAGVSDKAVSTWEVGTAEPRMGAIQKIANHFDIRKSEIIDDKLPSNLIPLQRARRIPILGTIACGSPIFAEENFEGFFIVDFSIKADFCLRARGDSMIDAAIYDGDMVFIRKASIVESGSIGVVLIGDEATLKRVYIKPDHLILQPCNPAYAPIIVKEDEEVRILGEMVGVYHERTR